MQTNKTMTLRQPKWKVTFDLNLDEPVTLDAIDDWLNSVLDIKTTDIQNHMTALKDDTLYPIEAISWRILLLLRSLQQTIRLPCFDLGDIITIKQDIQKPTQWSVAVHLVSVEHIPKSLYHSLIHSSIKIIFWVMNRKKTQNDIHKLYALIHKQILHPLMRTIGAGKSTLPILNAAHQKNIPFIHLGKSIYQLGWGCKSSRLQRSGIELDSAIGVEFSHNKLLSSQLFRMAGLPAPEHEVAMDENGAVKIAHSIGWPIVVKPADTDRGEGVTMGIKDEKHLLDAFRSAQSLSHSKEVIIEKEVKGLCYRLFIVNGKLLYAIKRMPKTVKGDGQKSVLELINESNKFEEGKPPWLRDTRYPTDTLALEALGKAGFNFNSILKKGVLAPLRFIESTMDGGTFEDVTHTVHPDNLEIALRAAQICGLNVAGVDIITTDIQKPWHQTNAIINEINYTPLLGGNEISKKYISLFLNHIIEDDGRIPIEIFVGGEKAMQMAQEKQKSLITKNIKCYLTSHKRTYEGSTSKEMILPYQSLYKRCQALLLNPQVEALILVIQTDEFLYTGIPVDQFTHINIAKEELTTFKTTTTHEKTTEENYTNLLKALQNIPHDHHNNITI